MGPKLIDVTRAGLDEPLCGTGRPVPPIALCPDLAIDEDLISIARVRLQTGDPGEIRGLGHRRRHQLTGQRVDVDARGPVRRRPRTDAVAPWRMHVTQIAVVHELPRTAARGSEVERAPGDQR